MRSITIVDRVVDGGPAYKIAAHCSLGQYVIEKLRECSNITRPALINGETGQQYAFKKLLEDTVNLATGLQKLGVKRGDTVGFCSESRIEYFVSVVAAICCGATVTPVNVQYTKDEMNHVLNISKPSIMFCSKTVLNQRYDVFYDLPCIEKIIQYEDLPIKKGVLPYDAVVGCGDARYFEAEPVQGWSDTVFILYSSGTTGLPKGVMLTHLNALYEAAILENESTIHDDNYLNYLTVVPWYHGYGLMSIINYIICNRTLVFFNGFNPQLYLNAIQHHKINVLLAVPPIVVFISKSPLAKKVDMSSIRVVWCAAAPVSMATIEEAMKRMPNCIGILQAYGLTESSTAATKDIVQKNVISKLGSGGPPVGGIKMKVVDVESRQKLGPYEKGEICLAGPIIMKGYAGNDTATRQMYDEEGYIKTGDIGYYDEDGYVFVVDRLKEIIKYKGYQVPPAEVESVLLQHSAVAECGVVGAPDERAGELPTAFVVLKPGAQVTAQELIDYVSSRLSLAKRLHGGVNFVADIPKNPSGKILRRVLRERLLTSQKSKL